MKKIITSIFLLFCLLNNLKSKDIYISGYTIAPSMFVGDTYNITVILGNNGIAFTGSFWVSFNISPNTTYAAGGYTYLTDYRVTGGMTANSTKSISLNITIPNGYATGIKNILIGGDALNEITSEISETNNETYAAVLIKTYPDLTPAYYSLSSTSFTAGSSITATFKVQNTGTASTGSFRCGFYLSPTQQLNDPTGTIIDYYTISSIAGSTLSGNLTKVLTIPSNKPSGIYYLHIWVDDGQSIIETNDNNNFQNITVSVTGGCSSPSASVNSPTGAGSVSMNCSTTGGSGGSISYKWYSGTSCSGTVIGTNSSYITSSSGYYSCKAYISGFESTCYSCGYGYATISVPSCLTCPSFDYTISPNTSWQTHSSSHNADECKIYRVSIVSGNNYTFKTGCGNGATASYDTYLELYNSSCSQITYDDDGCENARSSVTWNANYSGFAYLKVRGFNSTSYGSYSLSYLYSAPCSPPTITASSNSPITAGGTLNLSTTYVSGASYFWTGPNSYSSALQNPASITNVNTSMAGNYCVTANVSGCSSNQSCVSVTINAILPIADFFSYNHDIYSGQTLQLHDNSQNNPTSWYWRISGGNPQEVHIGSLKDPYITFTNPGSYSVTLISTNSAGSSSPKTINGFITVRSGNGTNAQTNMCYDTRDGNYGAHIADPIEIGTGTYKYRHTDFLLPVVSGSINFTRIYNSINYSVDGPLGFGWSHSYNYKIVNTSDTLWQVKYPDGHIADFIPLFDVLGTSFPLFGGTTDSLFKSSNSFNFITKDQSYFQFDLTGRLKSITDPNNNTTSLHYSGNLLDSVVGPGNRYFVFTGNITTGRISSIRTPSGNVCNFRIDANSNLVSATNPNGDSIRFTYDSIHQLLSFINGLGDTVLTNEYSNNKITAQYDVYGKKTNIAYDIPSPGYTTVTYPDNSNEVYFHNSFHVMTSKKDALNKTSTYSYDDNFNPDTIINEKNLQKFIRYDKFGNPLQHTLPGNRTFSSNFNVFQKPTQITNPKGNSINFIYNSSGNLTSISFPDNSFRYFDYNLNGTVKAYKNGNGDSTYYFYNNFGDLIQIKTPIGFILFTYNADGRLVSITDENSKITNITYDNSGKINSITDPLNLSITFNYDADNQLMSYQDKKGYTTYFYYDKKGRLIARKNPQQGIDSFFYDLRDNLIKIKDPMGHITIFNYDVNGRRLNSNNGLAINKFEYDELGNPTKLTDANNHDFLVNYSPSNEVISIIDPLNHISTITYDSSGNLKSFTNYKGRTKSFDYTSLNYLSQVLDVDNELTKYQYDNNGNINLLTDANNHSQSFSFGKSGNISSYTDGNGNPHIFSYDSTGAIKTLAKPIGNISFQYDELRRLTKKTLSSGDVKNFVYDANNNIIEASNNIGSSHYFYDSLNRLVRYVDPFNKEVLYGFNAAGSIVFITYPGNKTVNYTYDITNRLIKVKDWKNNEFNYTYDSAGNLKQLLYPTGIHCEYNYDATNRLISKFAYLPPPSNKVLYGQQFTYFNDSIREVRYGSAPANLQSSRKIFQYRNDDALINDSINKYINDSNGNRILEIQGVDSSKYVYSTDQMLTSYSHGGVTTNYFYDAFNVRLARSEGSIQTKYVVNPNSPLSFILQITDGSGNLKNNCIWGLGLLELIDSLDHELFLHFDSRHNTIAVTDINDSIRATYTYLLHGTIVNKTGTIIQPFTFLGEFGVEMESETWYYIRARYYDASTDRFLTKDPLMGDIFDPQSLNRYIYAMNDPLTMYDVTGLMGNKDGGGFSTLDKIGISLDIIGSTEIPIISWGADLSSGLLSFTQGDWKGGLISFGGILIPGGSEAKLASRLSKDAKYIEDISKAGHTIPRHVAKSEEYLIGRFSKNDKLTKATTYYDQDIAQDVVNQTLNANRDKIDAWLLSGAKNNLPLNFSGNYSIGEGILKNGSDFFKITDLNQAKTILSPTGNGGYFIKSSFPF